jgi:hypothetical protein
VSGGNGGGEWFSALTGASKNGPPTFGITTASRWTMGESDDVYPK